MKYIVLHSVNKNLSKLYFLPQPKVKHSNKKKVKKYPTLHLCLSFNPSYWTTLLHFAYLAFMKNIALWSVSFPNPKYNKRRGKQKAITLLLCADACLYSIQSETNSNKKRWIIASFSTFLRTSEKLFFRFSSMSFIYKS